MQLAVAASVLVALASATAAPVPAPETPPATEAPACVQPLARLPLLALTGPDGVVRLMSATGAVSIANGATVTLKSDPSVSKGVQVSNLDGRVTVVAERMYVRKIAGKQYAFLYDRPGEACALDQLPKELQPET